MTVVFGLQFKNQMGDYQYFGITNKILQDGSTINTTIEIDGQATKMQWICMSIIMLATDYNSSRYVICFSYIITHNDSFVDIMQRKDNFSNIFYGFSSINQSKLVETVMMVGDLIQANDQNRDMSQFEHQARMQVLFLNQETNLGLDFTNTPECAQDCISCRIRLSCEVCQTNRTWNGTHCSCITSSILINGNCVYFPGCLAVTFFTNAQKSCTKCDQNFIKVQQNDIYTCQCIKGTTFNNEQCQPICGDNITLMQECDDGNLVDGDGCSSFCSVQTGYYCKHDLHSISQCWPKINATLQYMFTFKEAIINRAMIQFKLQPQQPQLPQNYFNGQINTNIPHFNIQTTYNSQYSVLTIIVDYKQTLQNKSYTLEAEFQKGSDYFVNKPLSFITNGINLKLNYVEHKSQIQNWIPEIVMWLSFIVLAVCLLASVCGFSVMSLQLLLPVQATFFTLCLLDKMPEQFSYLNRLIYINGYNRIRNYDLLLVYNIPNQLTTIQWQYQFIYNINYMVIPTVILSITIAIIFLISQSQKKKLAIVIQENNIELFEEIECRIKSMGRLLKFIIRNLMMFMGCLLLYGFMFSYILTIEVFGQYEVYQSSSEWQNMLMFGYPNLVVLIIILPLGTILNSRKSPLIYSIHQKNIYMALYIILHIIFTMFIIIFYQQTLAIYLALILSFSFLIIIIIIRPFSIIYRYIYAISAQLIMILTLLMQICLDIIPEGASIYCVLVICCLMVLTILLCLLNIYHNKYGNLTNTNRTLKNANQQPQDQSIVKQMKDYESKIERPAINIQKINQNNQNSVRDNLLASHKITMDWQVRQQTDAMKFGFKEEDDKNLLPVDDDNIDELTKIKNRLKNSFRRMK